MATGKSGSLIFNANGGQLQTRVGWSEEYDDLAATSLVSLASLEFNSSSVGGTWYPTGTISVDGKTVVTMNGASPATHRVAMSAGSAWYPIESWSGGGTVPPWESGVINHDSDGSKTVTISLEFTLWRSDGSTIQFSASQQITLTTIPRASTIGATDANIGAVSMIAVNRNVNTFTHSIAYKFGSLSGYVTAAGGTSSTEQKLTATSIAFTIPASFYAQIGNAKSGVCTLTCKTYSGSTQIGSAQTAQFNVIAAQSASAPTVSGTVVDSNATTKALTGNSAKLVRFYSSALCTISASAKNSAAIALKKIGGVEVSGNTRTIAEIEATSVAFYAKDSRGYETSVDVPVDLIPYVKLTNNPTAQRTDPTSGNAVLTVKGNYFNGSFGAQANTIKIQYRVKQGSGNFGNYVTVTPTLNGNTYSVNVSLSGLDYQYAYTVEVAVEDKLSKVIKSAVVRRGKPIFDWGENDFNFNVPLFLNGSYLFPPMALGVEYPLPELHEGKPAYAKLTKIGTLPSTGNTYARVAAESGASVYWTHVYALTSSGTYYPLPLYSTDGIIMAFARHVNASGNLFIYVNADCSAYTAYAIAKYTKA